MRKHTTKKIKSLPMVIPQEVLSGITIGKTGSGKKTLMNALLETIPFARTGFVVTEIPQDTENLLLRYQYNDFPSL